MTEPGFLLLRFSLASLGCVAAGFGVWALTTLLRRYLPAVAMQRSVWLLGQVTVAATFLVILLPHSERLSVVPSIDIRAVTAADPTALAAPAVASSVSANTASGNATAERSLLATGTAAWLVVYLLGIGWSVARLLRAQRALNTLAASGRPLTDPHAHEGFRSLPVGAAVIEIDAPISPMLAGPFRPRLLLPAHLRSFDAVQQQMIVDHELTHLRRGDLQWSAAGVVLQTLLWFNPFVRLLRTNLSWAQELGCDRDVLEGRPQAQRKAYAAALVSQLKLHRRPIDTALAFGGGNASTLAVRVSLIRDVGVRPGAWWARCAAAGGLAAVFIGSLALQPALARHASPFPQAAPGPQGAPEKWLWPIENAARISSFFGTASPARRNAHRGIDFAVKSGTPVLASADGTVIASTDRFDGKPNYGNAVLIAHANHVTTLYAHLSTRSVREGDTVRAGQVLGLSGATGKVTGPHLHFEVREGATPINPETVLTGLDAIGTANALRKRLALPD